MATAEIAYPWLIESRELALSEKLKQWVSGADLAMDLGTANTLVYLKGRGVVINEPSMVAVDRQSGKALAVGKKAKEIFGKTSEATKVVRPMKDGVIADFSMTQLMISTFLSRVRRRSGLSRPLLVVGVPSEITQVEKRAVIEAAQACGIKRVLLIEEPMAAALGVGLPVKERGASLIVDIGGGTTDVAIVGMGSTVHSQCIRVAGDEMDEAIQRALQKNFGLRVGIFEAERIKIEIGSAPGSCPSTRSICAHGIDVSQSMPRKLEISGAFVQEALLEPVHAICNAVRVLLEQASPDVSQDLLKNGGTLAGGGSLLPGLAALLSSQTGLNFKIAKDPLTSIVRGVGAVIERPSEYRSLCIS
jgi:rod shape-determining protein MreB